MSTWQRKPVSARPRGLALGAVIATVLAGTPLVEAKPNTRAVVLEVHVGKRLPNVASAMATVVDELERHGFAGRPESVERVLGGREPRPGRLDDGKSIADIKRLIAAGRSAFDKGQVAESETTLRSAVSLIRRNPALLVLDTNNEKVTYGAFLALAMVLEKRHKDDEAKAVMLDLLRLSSMPIPQNDFGPKAQDLHKEAEKQALAMGRGSMTISADDSRAMIFVDYTYRGLGHVALGDQLPGSHYVLLQVPGTVGLQYVRDVQPSGTAALDVSLELESMLHVDHQWVGYLFGSEAERTRHPSFAKELAHRFDGCDVVVLSLQDLDGAPFIGGIQYPANGDAPIGAFVPANASEGLLRALATFLYDGTMAAGLRVLRRPEAVEEASADVVAADSKRWNLPGWAPSAVAGAGALTVAVGGISYLRKSFDIHHPPAGGTDGKNGAVEVMLGGSIVLGGGVYLWTRNSLDADRLTAAALGTGAAATAAGIELYLVHQEPAPELPRYIRGTGTVGIVVGTAGLALTGAGVWRLVRSPARKPPASEVARQRTVPRLSWIPFASVDASQTMLGCVGSY